MHNKYQLVVLGGGLAGVAAAIAAARENIRVLIIERYGFLGGAATNSQVNPFMPYTMQNENSREVLVNAGIFELILHRLNELGGLHENKHTFNEELMKIVLDRLLMENEVDVLFHSYLISAKRVNNHIESISVVNKSGIQTICADFFIDCTGDADLSFLADCPYYIGRSKDQLCQPMTLCFRLSNVNTAKYEETKPKINELYKEYQKQGKIKNPRENLLVMSHMSNDTLHFNSTRIVKLNPLDVEDLSKAEILAREQMLEIYCFLKNNIEGFENCVLLMSAPQIGVRESRMIEGEYRISEQDLINCIKFEDSIARGNYGIDIHNPEGTGTVIMNIPKGDFYTIPLRALIPKGIDNLLVAGRCVSSTHEAQSAIRIMPICCCMGEGAGTAIGIALNDNVPIRDISNSKLHSILDKYNALY